MKYYVVDAFADRAFEGNPAAVCIADQWPEAGVMQSIARENNLSETAFAVRQSKGFYALRWFTPGGEIDLCGHATLATAFVLFRFYETEAPALRFETKSGLLTVTRKGELFEMDFPAYALTQVPVTDELETAIGARPVEAWMGRDLLCVMESEEQVRSAQPDQQKVLALDGLLLQVTAAGKDFDCVSRTFAPKCGIAEDPVCGSGHCHIIPYWAKKLGKSEILARQASPRGGTLHCAFDGERVRLAGKAVLYAAGELLID